MDVRRCTYPLLAETTYSMELPSGLTVIAMPRSGFQRYYAVFMTKYGSNDSQFIVPGQTQPTEVPDGIAHFLEHQLFAKPWGSADERFAAWGASPNAFTSWTRTGYLFSTTDNFNDCFRFLIDYVLEPYFTVEGTEKEKGIIEQEIGMYDDDPGWQLTISLLQALFHQHPVRRDIVGTVESVRQINKQLLDDCYRTFYHPSNMVLVATGDFDPAVVLDMAAEQVANKRFVAQGDIGRVYPEEPVTIAQSVVTRQMHVALPLFGMGFKETELGASGAALLRQRAVTELVLEAVLGRSSELYQELYAAGLIDTDFGAFYVGQPDHGYSLLQGESKDPARVREAILVELQRLSRTGLDEAAFVRSRKALYGSCLRNLNIPARVANDVADCFFDQVDYLLYPEVLAELTLAEANARLRQHLDPAQAAFAQILPLE